MDEIYEWMRNFSYYMMLLTVLLQLLPNNDYKKYIRFFTGLILILIMCGPIMKILHVKDMDINYEQRVEEIERATEYFQDNLTEME